jgi:hypothetical protein
MVTFVQPPCYVVLKFIYFCEHGITLVKIAPELVEINMRKTGHELGELSVDFGVLRSLRFAGRLAFLAEKTLRKKRIGVGGENSRFLHSHRFHGKPGQVATVGVCGFYLPL